MIAIFVHLEAGLIVELDCVQNAFRALILLQQVRALATIALQNA